jgi:hypothetical protein
MTTTRSRRMESEEVWMERLERFRKHQGSRSDFCRREGITLTGLSYWLKKVSASENEPTLVRRRSAFVPVEVVSESISPVCDGRGLPDPRWTAEFLRHFLGASP